MIREEEIFFQQVERRRKAEKVSSMSAKLDFVSFCVFPPNKLI